MEGGSDGGRRVKEVEQWWRERGDGGRRAMEGERERGKKGRAVWRKESNPTHNTNL